MKQVNLFLLILVVWGSIAYGQTNIGLRTDNSDNSPIHRNMAYSASELLYVNTEINNSDYITQAEMHGIRALLPGPYLPQ